MITPKWTGKIDGGALVVDDAVGYCQYLIELGRRPEPLVEIVVKPKSKRKSKAQRGYYWSVILKVLSDFSGHSRWELHDAMKIMFLSYIDDGIKYVRSTEDLTTAEAEEYYEQIRRWADETISLRIPLPNEVDYD